MDRRLTAALMSAVRRTATVSPRRAMRQLAIHVATAVVLLMLGATRAWAAGPAMPWDTALDNLLNNLSGPTARALVLVAIVGTGLLWAFTRNEEGLKRVGQIAFGGAIAMGAVTLFANLGFTAGALL